MPGVKYISPIKRRSIYVCHHCDNPICVRPSHLFLGTSRINLLDAVNKGRHTGTRTKLYGDKNPAAKLTIGEVREIRRQYIPGKTTLISLGQKFNINFRTVSLVVNNKIWKDQS